jgi:hypothetical protein
MTRINANFNSTEVYSNISNGTNGSNTDNFNPYTNVTNGAQTLQDFTDPYISTKDNNHKLPTFSDPYMNGKNNNQALPTFSDPYMNGKNNNQALPTFSNPYQTKTGNSTLSNFTNPYGVFESNTVNSGQFGKSIDPFSSFFTSQGQNQSYLDQYATVKPSDYQVSQIDLDETKTNLESTPIPSLNNKTFVSYYKGILNKPTYRDTLIEAESKIKNKTSDSSLSQLGFFRDYLYNMELQNSIFDTKLSSGQRRHNYELLSQALNPSLNTKDKENPLNTEMEKYIIPEMMRLMAKDGTKVVIQNGSEKTAYSGNKTEASQEFIFQMDNMNWRTQIGDETFTKYAKLAINNAQDPNSAHSYTRMYESTIVKGRKDFTTQLNTLKNKEPELVTALKANNRNVEQKALINSGINPLEKILNNDLKYSNANEALKKANDALGSKNVINSLILFLVTTPIEITNPGGVVTKVDSTNIFTKDSKTNTAYIDDDRVKEELTKRLQILKTSVAP